MDFTNVVIQAELLAIIGILITMAYFFVKLGLFKSGAQKKTKTPKADKKAKAADNK